MFRHLRREAYLIMAFAASLLMMTGCDMFRMESQEPIGWHVGESCLRSTNDLVRLEAFALCIPGAVFRENQFMRYEQFTYKGILVFNE